MALTTYIIYNTTTGEIAHSYYCDDANTPMDPGTGEAFLDGGLVTPLPDVMFNKVDLGGPTVVAKTAQEQQDFKDALRKAQLECVLIDLDNEKAARTGRGFDTTVVDAQIADAEAEYNALP